MQSIKHIGIIIIAMSLFSCSNNEQKVEEKKEEKILATVDTTNTLIAPVCLNGKWGFIGSDLKFIIEPQFEQAMEFNEGLACVESGEKWGFVNLKGEFVIPAKYDYPGTFHDGLAKVGNHKSISVGVPRYIFIDKTDKDVFGEKYTFAEDFNNGVSYVKTEDGKGKYIDLKGNTLDSVQVNLHPLVYNHFKYTKRPFGGELSKSLVLDKKTGNPVDVKYSKSNYGYTDEMGHPATEAIYCFAGEFRYSFQTPKIYFSTNKNDTISTSSSFTEVNGVYVRTENIEEGDNSGIKIIFKIDNGAEIIFDGYNDKSKLIPLYFICSNCTSTDYTIKSSVGRKYLLKYSIQKAEGSGGDVQEFKILEAIDVAK